MLLATGYTFTPRNMIVLSNMYRQERMENEAQRRNARDAQGSVFVLPLIHSFHATPGSPTSPGFRT